MNEIEKTKQVPIGIIIFLLIVIIALLVYKKPRFLFKETTVNNIEQIHKKDFIISYNDVYHPNYVLVDTRAESDFKNAHFENAIHIAATNILDDKNIAIFDKLKSEHKTVILYGNNPNEVAGPFMILQQLGFNNIKILAAENTCFQNNLFAKRVEIEKSKNDVNAFIAKSENIANDIVEKQMAAKRLAAKPKPKKVIPVKKKKKMPMEGGC